MAGPLADGGGGEAELAAPFARLPGALQALQDRAVAEAVQRAAGLLRDHYALYHRGGGGGGWPLLAEATCAGGETSVRLPASGSLPAGFRGLLLFVQGRAATATIDGALYLRLNGDTAAHYQTAEHYGRASGAHGVEGEVAATGPSTAGYLGRLTSASKNVSAAQVWLPFAARAAFWQSWQADALNDYYAGTETQLQHAYGLWMQAAAVTDLTVFVSTGASGLPALSGGLAADSYLAVYGIGGP